MSNVAFRYRLVPLSANFPHVLKVAQLRRFHTVDVAYYECLVFTVTHLHAESPAALKELANVALTLAVPPRFLEKLQVVKLASNGDLMNWKRSLRPHTVSLQASLVHLPLAACQNHASYLRCASGVTFQNKAIVADDYTHFRFWLWKIVILLYVYLHTTYII